MIALRSTDTLRVTQSSTNRLDASSVYVDSNASTFNPDRELHQLTTLGPNAAVSSPSAGLVRTVKLHTLFAQGGANTVTVDVFDGATAYDQITVALLASDTLCYEDAAGWFLIRAGAVLGLGATGATGSTGATGATGATGPGINVQSFQTAGSYTWTKPSGAKRTDIYAFGVGGPAGSGRAAAATGSGNNGGGASGTPGQTKVLFGQDASLLGATETVTIGADSVGGVGVSGTNNGNPGTIGGSSSFGAWVTVAPGSVGGGGIATGSNSPGTLQGGFFGGAAINANATSGTTAGVGTSGQAGSGIAPGSGAGGAGESSAGGANSAGAAGGGNAFATGGTAGAVSGGNGGNGADAPAGYLSGGAGGGSGGAKTSGNGGNGGNGGFPAGSGGGGGGCIGGTSGAGGKGGGALIVAITHCG